MSTFAVEVRKIGTIIPHPNADRLDIATVEGMAFQFVVGKGNFVPGDYCVYFPLDSILPDPLCEGLGFAGKLSGPGKNRVKSIRLRNEVSQGLAVPLSALFDIGEREGKLWIDKDNPRFAPRVLPTVLVEVNDNLVGLDLTELLGVRKYEPVPIPCYAGNLVPLPDGQEVYDIEGSDRFPSVAQELIEKKIPVRILEKVEGTNFSITASVTGDVWVCQRNNAIEELQGGGKENMFWRVARKQGLTDLIKSLLDHHKLHIPGLDKVILRGELIGPGIQQNIYALKDTRVVLFDLATVTQFGRRTYRNWEPFKEDLARFNALNQLAPVIAENVLLDVWLAGRSLREASHGPSALNPSHLREGIVITPMEETHSEALGGRLIIKQRDPIYLDKADC
jgi:RNA ligase (TIGR02306 family)